MTPDPPSHPEGLPLPPRSRPVVGDFVKDSHENDLWAFDDLDSPEDAQSLSSSRSKSPNIPIPRNLPSKSIAPSKAPTHAQDSAAKESIKLDIGKAPEAPFDKAQSQLPKPINDVDELDDWEVAVYEPPTLSVHPSLIGETAPEEELQVAPPQKVAEILSSEEASSTPNKIQVTSAETTQDGSSGHLVPHLGLSKLEKISLWVLLALLLVGGGLIFISVSNRLSTDTGLSKAEDFPVKGQHLEILAAMTYWRAPIADGKGADTVRRGTQLLPVLVLTSKGGPAAVRLFFRNQDGVVMGDAVTRAILPGVPLEVAATAGFDDLGMHAAYRTGQSKPWTIEVREAPNLTSPNSEFKRLFDVAISTERR
jgi:hypothetical protein